MTDLYPDDELGPPPDSPDKSMYDRLGPTAVRIIVEQLYARVFADQNLTPWFADLTSSDAATLRRHFGLMLRQMLGASTHFTLDELARSHRRRQVTGAAFDRFAGHLINVLDDLQVDVDIRAHVAAALSDLRPLMVVDMPPATTSHGGGWPAGSTGADQGRG